MEIESFPHYLFLTYVQWNSKIYSSQQLFTYRKKSKLHYVREEDETLDETAQLTEMAKRHSLQRVKIVQQYSCGNLKYEL